MALSSSVTSFKLDIPTRTHTQHEFELRADKVKERRQQECGKSGGGAVELGEKRVANALNVAYLDIFRFTAYTHTPAHTHWHTERGAHTC